MTIAGVYAKSLSSQLENADILWDTEQDDSALGEFLGEQNRFTQTTASSSGISSGMADVIKNTFEPFMHKFMDALDRSIDKHKEMVSKKPWMQGTIRTTHIDRSRVFRSFQSSLTSF